MKLSPIARGVALALVAAVTFGVTTPFVKLLSTRSGPFPTAMLLYAGASIASVRWRRAGGTQEPGVRPSHFGRLLLVALSGAVVAPVCLAWGLRSTSATAASLLLNFEVVFTVLLGWRLHREPLGRQVALALVLMVGGGAVLALPQSTSAVTVGWGSLAVIGASFAWAADNALSRPLADLDPVQVTRWKGALGAGLTLMVTLVWRSSLPTAPETLGLLLCGAVGYGLSLRFYLRAQRLIGAGRTASMFGLAPFIGALVAWAMGDRSSDALTVGAALLFGIGVYLHATEKHAHPHEHEALEHEHPHRHDDGHHDHAHDPPVGGEHSHPHAHDARRHEHAHGSDLHHQHH